MKRLMIYTKKHYFTKASSGEQLKLNSTYILMMCFTICGIISGSTFIFLHNYEFIKDFLNESLFNYSNLKFFSLYAGYSLIFIILTGLCGLSSLGYPVICLNIFLRGFADGYISAVLLNLYGIKGFAVFCLIFIPAEMIFLTVYLYISEISSCFSGAIASYVFFGNKDIISLKNNVINIIIAVSAALISALIILICRSLFIGLF